jgi:polyisoprenoid-binding protein YceI
MNKRIASTLNVLAVVAGLLSLAPHPALAARFEMKTGEKTNRIEFESKAPMETFSGKTSQVSGHVVLDPASIGDSIEVYVEVPVATLDTGIELRNQHMCENHLETEKFPNAIFRGAKLTAGNGSALEAGKTVRVEVEGTFEVHGVTKPLRVPVDLTFTPGAGGGTLRTVARFQVKLADYEIKRPSFLVMKLDEVQRITFDVTAHASP